jgi:uncharacterized protein YbcI
LPGVAGLPTLDRVSLRTSFDATGTPTDRAAVAGQVGVRSPMLEISNAMVRLYKEAFGRGPTKARSNFAGPDTLIVVLENSMTVSERQLAQAGEQQRVREVRLILQHLLEDQFRRVVEQALGRRTVAYVGGLDADCDLAIQVFTLESQAPDLSDRAPDLSDRAPA